AAAGVQALAMELMPRITRAQTMDILSSQSNLAGYKAVLDAAAHYGRAFPMMMTAAGTIPAARVFIIGVGVAGLQAIATARRLGARRPGGRAGGQCRRGCRRGSRRTAWCEDRRLSQRRQPFARRRLGPVRPQSLQFSQHLLGQGAGARAPRR